MHTKILVLMSLFPTHFAIIFLAIPFSTTASTNANYSFCSNLYSCGSIRNIGYPFWGAGRPDFCGHLEFHLNCVDEDKSTRMNIPSLGYAQVFNINTSSHKMSIAPTRFMQTPPFCQPHDNNQTTSTQQNSHLLPAFKICPTVINVTLFYGCNQSVLNDHHPKSFNCLSDDYTNGSVSYFGKMSQVIKRETNKSCRNNYSVLVLKTELDELNNGRENLLGVLRKGIELEYIVNFTACTACQASGGNCGSSSSSKFVCYCPHGRPQSLRCLPQEKSYLKLTLLGLGVVGILIILVAVIWCHKKLKIGWRKSLSMIDRATSDVDVSTISFEVPVFSYAELRDATQNFHESNILGDGGFGTVYYGKLKDGREVAVKRLFEKNYKRVEQFMNEVRILTCLKHPNLVILYGCTSRQCNQLLLVYEYIPNGTVADHLYGDKHKPKYLPWHIRMNIAIETASALAYLHASEIVHRDVKTSNILLDNNFNVKVADFGLSRLLPTDVTHVSTAPQGTLGYLDPEYYQNYQLTDKSDVFSFGVVLVELISSLPAVDMERHKQEINLSNYAISRIQRSAFHEVVDPQLGFMSDYKVRGMTILVAELAFRCLQHDKESRPTMEEVLDTLRRIQSADYEELKADDEAKNDVSNRIIIPPPSPLDKDDATLLISDDQQYEYKPPSPKSVMDKWASRFTTPNTSK